MHEEILRLASAIARPSEDEEALLEALCTAAETEITQRLREDVTPEQCGSVFFCAAGLLAAAGLLPCREYGGVEQFTAGEVSLRKGGGRACETAAAMRRQAAAMMAPYWRDDGFVFRGVRG